MLPQETLNKPFSPSCEENRQVIYQAIEGRLKKCASVLEIASGTGQHAVFFAEHLPNLTWQTSDLNDSLEGIRQWISDAGLDNVLPPLALNVSEDLWPKQTYDAVFSANSFHIMAHQNVADFFAQLPSVLTPGGWVMIYGPFNYGGDYTSDSNARFDQWLKQRNPSSGIKDFEWCQQMAEKAGLTLIEQIAMPQNNRLLFWQKSASTTN